MILIEHTKHGRMHVYSEHELEQAKVNGWREIPVMGEPVGNKEVLTNENSQNEPRVVAYAKPEPDAGHDGGSPDTNAIPTRKLRSDEELINGVIVRKKRVKP